MGELASPYSTGGGGGDFETRVLAYYLGSALTQAIPRGLPDATASSVSSQALYQGAPLDDILVRANRGDGEAQLALQVKRDLTFGDENEEFQDVMRRAWETFTAGQFHENVDRFGVALGLYSKKIDEHYTTVLTWARNSTTAADFLARLAAPRLASQTQRTFLALIRTMLERATGRAITDDELWRFCRSFVLLHFDLQSDGSRDAAQLRSMLQHALNIDAAPRARDLEQKLFEFASVMKLSAGTHSTTTLREALATEHFALRPAHHVVADLQRLREYGQFILNDISTTAGGVSLPRTEHVQRAAAVIATGRLVALGGEPGTGKSGVLRLLIDEAHAESSALLLSGDRLHGTDWPTFAQHLGLSSNLRDLLRAVATSTAPCIFIDGLDRVTTPHAQRIINDLLRTVAQVSVADARPWTVVFTSRTQNLTHVMGWIALPPEQAVQTIEVAALTDVEFEVIAAQHPSLALLDGDERLRPMTRNLFMVGRLTDPRVATTLPTQTVQTELDLAIVWWTHVVGAGAAAGVARQTLLVNLAADLLREERANGPYEPAALHSLEADRIVSRDSFGVVRFTHDLFEDWVLARLLGQKGPQLPAFLVTVPAPFRLQRGVRLLGALLLQEGQLERWRELLVGIEGDAALKERWQQTFVSSPLLSARAMTLLDEIQPFLLEGTSERLRALLTATVTLDVGPNVFWGSVLRALPTRPELAALFMHEPTPRWAIWIPLVTWLTTHADTIPVSLRRDAVRILELWQAHAPEGSLLRGEVADTALRWFADRADLAEVTEDGLRRYYTTLRKIIFASADVRPDAVKEIVRRIAANRHDGARRQVVEAGAALSKHIPSEYVDAILSMVIRERDRERHHLIDDFDFDDRPFYPASYAQGPFIFLLKNAEAEGLRLVHTLANTAIDRWREREEPTPAPIVLQLASGPQEFFGTGREYMWFRSDAMAPPSVISALMALEFWMEQEVERGRDAVELFETVLAGSRCLAVPGLCLGIALAYSDKCLRAALPIVAVPHFWLLDVSRMGTDSTGSFGTMLPGNDLARKLNEDRDKRPQRRQSIRDLAIRYLCSAEEDLTERFTTAIAAFAEHPVIFFEEQRDDAAYLETIGLAMEREIEFGKVENYRRIDQDGQTIIYFEKPQ